MHVRPVPKVSIFMALTTKIVTEKAKKWPKMARFWPKSRYNGRVMAREVFFYQCLWVTKFCAKFGCSRTPRTASVPNSFIVLRCMWKEPAPLFVNFELYFDPKTKTSTKLKNAHSLVSFFIRFLLNIGGVAMAKLWSLSDNKTLGRDHF